MATRAAKASPATAIAGCCCQCRGADAAEELGPAAGDDAEFDLCCCSSAGGEGSGAGEGPASAAAAAAAAEAE